MFTATFWNTLDAYQQGYRIINNKGGSRSGKTFGELQLLDLIAQKPKRRVITTVSHSHPHLVGGAIRDFDSILSERNIMPDDVRTKNPYVYTYPSGTIHEFIGFDKPGKALGAARDILFVNEANKMDWAIVHQLMQRTRETIFIDYNPSNQFWIDQQGILLRPDCITLTSTFLDNYDNLTDGQIEDFKEAKRKYLEEKERGIFGYWSNWWYVYGLGKHGQVEGAIYSNWKTGEFDQSLPYGYGLDFGSRDPDALVKVAIDQKAKKIYVKQLIYKSGNSTGELHDLIKANYIDGKLIIADSAGVRTIEDLKGRGLNIKAVEKGAGSVVDGIKLLQEYEIIITPESIDLINEITGYVWLEKKGEVPMDKDNHLLDALRYYATTIIKPFVKRHGHKAL